MSFVMKSVAETFPGPTRYCTSLTALALGNDDGGGAFSVFYSLLIVRF